MEPSTKSALWWFGEKIPGARPSMLLDHMAGRRSEIDNINGAIPREGRKLGVPTPVSDAIVAMVRAKESAFGEAQSQATA